MNRPTRKLKNERGCFVEGWLIPVITLATLSCCVYIYARVMSYVRDVGISLLGQILLSVPLAILLLGLYLVVTFYLAYLTSRVVERNSATRSQSQTDNILD
jgi:hypothetical protein